MRPIVPISPKNPPDEVQSSAGREIIWHGVLPLRLMHQRLRLDMIVTSQAESPLCLTRWRRGVTLAVLQGMILIVFFLILTGAFLLFYLFKKAVGIDIFANFHLF